MSISRVKGLKYQAYVLQELRYPHVKITQV